VLLARGLSVTLLAPWRGAVPRMFEPQLLNSGLVIGMLMIADGGDTLALEPIGH
jgi:hypothetical protein